MQSRPAFADARTSSSSPATLVPGEASAPAGLIRVLGAFATEFRHAALDPGLWRRAHARRLLQLLGSAWHLSESRAKVLAALWPDFDEQRARNRLHHTVHWIRQGFETLPLALRPQIVVGAERVELKLPPDVLLDAQEFLAAFETEAIDDASRFAAVARALHWYQDDLATDWDSSSEIESRRAWLAGLFDQALAEAVQLATDLEYTDLALQYALRRALRPSAGVEAHCVYASLMADRGRPDAAVSHCRSIRDLLKEEDGGAVHRLDDLVRDIQQRANRPAAASATEPGIVAMAPEPARAALPLRKAIVGYQGLLEAASRTLADPYSTLVALVGPPGCGKTALAIELCHRTSSHFRHGVVWIDCQNASTHVADFLLAVARALMPRDRCESTVEAVMQALHGRELLVVLDGLASPCHPEIARAISAWHAMNRDVRWLVTAQTPLRLRDEKNLIVDPTDLLHSPDSATPPPAAQLVHRSGVHGWSLQDKRVRATVEAIALAVDGLPSLLEAAGRVLETMWPNELVSRLERDPVVLLRDPLRPVDVARSASPAGEALVRWVESASADLKRLLALAGRCRSWLSRDDLAALWDGEPAAVHGLVEQAVRQQLFLRRVRQAHDGAWSEFRVPRYAVAAQVIAGDDLPPHTVQARIAAWLTLGASPSDTTLAAVTRAATWFDDHIDDFEALVREWQIGGRHADLASLCAAQRHAWGGSRHAPRVLDWLTSLGEHMEQVPDACAAQLFVERARLRAQLGQLHGAFEDAGRAVSRLGTSGDQALRSAAISLIDRYGASQAGSARAPSVNAKGIEAGESLLRVAQATLRQGELAKALQSCAEAVGVFNHFGLTRGLLKSQQMRAKIAFALGDTSLAQQCILHVERSARALSDQSEAAKAELLRAAVLMSDMQFQRAIETTSLLMARPEVTRHPALATRGLLLLGWANYAMGAWPVARAFATELREQAKLSANMGTRVSVETLSALLDARQGSRAIAVRRVGELLDIPSRDRHLPDLQGDCVNAADLLLHLGRPDLATRALERLAEFSRRPQHRLRLWVAQRAHDLRAGLPALSEGSSEESTRLTVRVATLDELLESLVRP